MRKYYSPNNGKAISRAAKSMSIEHNVIFNVIDLQTNRIVQTHTGHNAATNTLLTGIAHYLLGDGIMNQGYEMLSHFVPRYMSLGTMGLISQEEDENHLPIGLGGYEDTLNDSDYVNPETERLCHYILQCPGYGADGYDANSNMERPYFGLGLPFDKRENEGTYNCELISPDFPRFAISFRDMIPEAQAEVPKTIDIIYSAMISTGALAEFREEGKDYIFITEAGLWTRKTNDNSLGNGLLAGYRIAPPNKSEWDFGTYVEASYDSQGHQVIPAHFEFDSEDPDRAARQKRNQQTLKKSILRVGRNQVVQIIWKIQIGGLDQLGGMAELYPNVQFNQVWNIWHDDLP